MGRIDCVGFASVSCVCSASANTTCCRAPCNVRLASVGCVVLACEAPGPSTSSGRPRSRACSRHMMATTQVVRRTLRRPSAHLCRSAQAPHPLRPGSRHALARRGLRALLPEGDRLGRARGARGGEDRSPRSSEGASAKTTAAAATAFVLCRLRLCSWRQQRGRGHRRTGCCQRLRRHPTLRHGCQAAERAPRLPQFRERRQGSRCVW